MQGGHGGKRLATLALAALLSLALAGCVVAPHRRDARWSSPAPVASSAPALYFYPSQSQSAERQDRDRFECYQWARHQTGIDPGMTPVSRATPSAPPRERGSGAAAGAVAGAIVGASVSSPRHAGGGFILGAVIGSMLGAAGDEQRARAAEHADAARQQHSQALTDRALDGFRRAMSACMTARGYGVG